jgi:hypothetical protein
MHTVVAVAILSLTLAVPMPAQHALAGAWEGQTNGGASIVLDLTVADKALTGTLTRNGQSTALSDGKVAGDSFTCKATLNDQQESISGERAGDELKVWLDRQGRETAIVLKRVKRSPPSR